ncbi:MAG: PA14 domain-containing protein [Vicinamibacteraceae bacterium]
MTTTTQRRWAGLLGVTLAAAFALMATTSAQRSSPAAGPPAAASAVPVTTLRLHPENPRYFLFRGKPTVIITSGEHYGALLNLDFDYRRYFDRLQTDGLNGTRIFAGTYVETGGNFDIASNTLDPAKGRFIGPWARSTVDGYADGGPKFDLTRFDDAYVARLRDVLKEASAHGIIVELVLFCPLYEDSMWAVSPLNPANNVNGFPAMPREHVLTLDKSGPLLAVQEAVARHLVAAVAGFDNVYLEICNEPYATHVPDDWQRHMTTVVADAVARLPQPVLLSQNVSNQGQRVVDPHPAISIFNFHYATPPDTIASNADLRRPIGDNETGFRGTADAAYRTEGWDFILAGGGLFNNLDYSFTVGHEDGTFQFPSTQPGGGGRTLRAQFGVLRRFINRFDLVKLRPAPELVVGGVPAGGSVQVLAQGEDAYGIYLRRHVSAASFSARWSGRILPRVSGTYQLHVTSNDGARVRIGDRVVYEDWTDHGTKTDTVSVTLANPSGVPLVGPAIVVEYFYGGGSGVMRLEWTRPDGVREIIPATAFRTGLEGVVGLKAEYFHGVVLADPWFARAEPTVDHDFGSTGPRRDSEPAAVGTTLDVTLPSGRWAGSWIDPVSGEVLDTTIRLHEGGVAKLALPPWSEDLALDLRRFVSP